MVTLFKKDSKGKLRIWTIRSDGAELIENYGLVDGKQARNNKTCKGKNTGKSNETSPSEQAKLELVSRVNKKRDEGYFDTVYEAERAVKVLPMLAKDFKKEEKKVIYPCYSQPKLDGMRCLYSDGKLISRKGKSITTMGHILSDLIPIVKETVLDGELYSHGISFQGNMKLIKKYREGLSEKISYYVYDIVEPSMDFETRYTILREICSQLKSEHIRLVPIKTIYDYHDLTCDHKGYLLDGYEGTIVRWGEEGYKVNGRSNQLLKFKDFQDVTATIVDVIPQECRPEQGVIVCNNSMGTFKATPKASHNERTYMLSNKNEYIGKTAEIRYFELTDDGIPRFPVYIGVRIDK